MVQMIIKTEFVLANFIYQRKSSSLKRPLFRTITREQSHRNNIKIMKVMEHTKIWINLMLVPVNAN